MDPFTSKNIIIIVPLSNFVLYKTVLQVYVGTLLNTIAIVIKLKVYLHRRKTAIRHHAGNCNFQLRKRRVLPNKLKGRNIYR